jgi:DNA-binding PadR family transcriptional regulator
MEKIALIFNTIDREVLKNVALKKKVNWYYFHQKYRLSPGQLSRSIRKLVSLEYIIIDDDNIELTPKGQKILYKERNKIFRKNEHESWLKVQDFRKAKNLKIDEFYNPLIYKSNK